MVLELKLRALHKLRRAIASASFLFLIFYCHFFLCIWMCMCVCTFMCVFMYVCVHVEARE